MSLASQRVWAVLFARLVLGLIFFMSGVAKVFQLGSLEHAGKYFLPFAGLLTRQALIALGAVLVIVTFRHLLHERLFT